MKIQQNKTKKFHKKTHFLQISLLKFLYWRDINSNMSLNEKQVKFNTECDIEKTIEQELLLVRNFSLFFNNNKFFSKKSSTNSFFEKNKQKHISDSSILSSFFPQRRSFMYYWILPFVGFVGLAHLNQNNQFKFYPSLELWPYLKKTIIAEQKHSDSQNVSQTKESIKRKTQHFFREYEAKGGPIFSLSWETLEYLNYKKNLYDQSKKYVSDTHTSKDSLCFVVKPNWVEHQKNQYSMTFKDFSLSNHFTKVLNLEKKEIENLWKFYLYQTQGLIYSQLPEKFNEQPFSKISAISNQSNSFYSKKQIHLIRNGLNAASFFDVVRAHRQNTKNELPKPKGELLKNIEISNLWNRSSIFWYWYQINCNDAFMSLKSNNSENFSIGGTISDNFSLFSKKSLKSHKNSFFNEFKHSIRKKINVSNGQPIFRFKMSFDDPVEITFLDLDEFPKKIFPVTINSNISSRTPLNASNKNSFSVLDQKTNIFKDQRTKKDIMHDEKSLTLDLFFTSNTQPIQSYKKASLLLDNWIKKLQLETKYNLQSKSVPHQTNEWDINSNFFDDRYAIKKKNNFIHTIENELNKIEKLKYKQHMDSSCLLKAANMNSFQSNSLEKLDEKNIKDKHVGFSTILNRKSNVWIITSVKKTISNDLRKIFCLKYLSFKTKNSFQNESKPISKINKPDIGFHDIQNHFDSTKENVSENDYLMTQLKLLNFHSKFLKRPINKSFHSPYETQSHFENNSLAIPVRKKSRGSSDSTESNEVNHTHKNRKKFDILENNEKFIYISHDKQLDKIRSLKKNIYELSVLRKFNKHLKKNQTASQTAVLRSPHSGGDRSPQPHVIDHPSNLFDDSVPMATKIKFMYNEISSKIPTLSYFNRNLHLNETLKKAKSSFLTNQNQKHGASDINSYDMPNGFLMKLQNALIVSGYEFPEYRIKNVFLHKNKIGKKYLEKNKNNKINEIKYIISLPPTFSKSIDDTLRVTTLFAAKKYNTQSSAFLENARTQYHDFDIRKQNSFLFQNYNHFFASFKQNSIYNIKSYWTNNSQKNRISSHIYEIKPSAIMQKNVMHRSLENNEKPFFYNKKQFIHLTHSNINRFYEYFRTIVRSLFIKLNSLLKHVLNRTQLKLLDRHNIESYLIFDSLNDSSVFSKSEIKMPLNVSDIKASNDESQKKSIAPKTANTTSPFIFKLHKTKKYLKNSVVFKNPEKRKVEKIFRTYLSCKANDVLLSNKRITAPKTDKKHDAYVFLTSKKRPINSNSHYITSALKKLKIRIKQNSLFHSTHNQKNKIKKSFVFKTTNKKQNSISSNKNEIKNIDNFIEKNNSVSVSFHSTKRQISHDEMIFRNKLYSMKFHQMSPNSLLKRLGFIFLNQSDKSFSFHSKKYNGEDVMNFDFNESSPISKNNLSLDNVLNKIPENFFQNDELRNERYSSHHEKQKYNQKKRRRKKQKLENRRRKKRKRFYPRPKWLRFELYNDFLKKRHFKHHINCDFGETFDLKAVQNSHSIKLKKLIESNLYKTSNKRSNNKTDSYEKSRNIRFNHFDWAGHTKTFNRVLKTKIYRQNKQQWGSCASSSDNPNFEKLAMKKMPLSWSLPIFANHDLFQISNVVMSDFQRLCWKSYWLRSNLTPYIHRIQSSLKKLQLSQIHEQSSKTLKTFVLNLLGFNLPQISSHLFNDQIATTFIHRHPITLDSILNCSALLRRPQTPEETALLRRPQTADRTRYDIENSKRAATSEIFDINTDTREQRLREINTSDMSNYSNKPSIFLTDKKSPQLLWYLNIRQSFQTRNVISDFSLFQNTQNIAEYNRILYERISDIIKNVRTNLNVNGQNHARSFKRGRRKSQKIPPNTRNLWARLGREINPEIRAFSPFASTIDTSIKPYGDLPTLRVLWTLNKTNVLTFKQNNAVKKSWATLKNREQNKSNKTKKFISNSWKKLFPENFEKYCFKKAFFVEDKIRHSGFIKKNYENYLIRLKMQFKSINIRNSDSDIPKISRKKDIPTFNTKGNTRPHLFGVRAMHFKKQALESNINKQNSVANTTRAILPIINDRLEPQNQEQNHPKRSMFFWWARFSQIHPASIFMQQTFMLPNFQITQSSLFSFTILSSLWICTVLFHVCSLFFVLNIPEIRSLMKFNLLIFYKISNSYLVLIYSIYDLLKNYKKQIINNFGFVYPRLINNTTRLISNNIAIKSHDSKVSDLDRGGYCTHSSKHQINKSHSEFFEHETKYNSNFSFVSHGRSFYSIKQTSRMGVQSIFFKSRHKKTKSFAQSFLMKKYNTNSTLVKFSAPFPFMRFIGNELKPQETSKKIHYLSKNGTFLETTFRVPAQLNENFIINVSSKFSRETQMRAIGDRNPIYSVFSSFDKNHSKIKALCYILELELQNRLNDSHIENHKKNKFSLVSTNDSTNEASQNSWQEKSQQDQFKEENNETNSILQLIDKNKLGVSSKHLDKILFHIKNVSYQKNEETKPASKKRVESSVFMTELASKKYITPIQSLISLVLLRLALLSIVVVDNCAQLFFKTIFKSIDILESLMLIIYKFLEKPAELMIDWIAQIFLVEWSSDIMTYLPEALDSSVWNSYVFLSRSTRIGGPIGFLLQRRLWCFMEIFIDFVSKPDADLLMRQKKGTIFWNIWAEILIRAAERYNINVQSLTTLKEEQESLIEKLLEDENWEWTKLPSNTLTTNTHDEMISPLIPLIKIIDDERLQNWAISADIEASRLYSSALRSPEECRLHYFVDRRLQTASQTASQTADYRPNSDINASDIWRRWSVNQYFTYQGKDTDLFIDIHPPKCFRHISAIKYYQPAQQTLGSLVCHIYSGTFSKQVSRNILVVGAPGIGKSLLVQALAGETELKIITDNAHRYAGVQRGVAIGMKLLRDVFDAIALHTPCLFLMEDIHVIGERRPMLISDDENAKATESFFASENEEVHEKNQLIYQLNKHAISHYKKPYKGDFSLLIPTNHFCFDLFLGVSPPKTRRSGMTPKSPLDIESIDTELNKSQNDSTGNTFSEQISLNASSNKMNTSVSINKRFPFDTLVSHLQIPSEKYFAPPPTSPFTILMMKEQKKLLPKKSVKQIPWSGLSWDQMMLVSKVSYSIRVKVALLADIAISNLSVKLDMITDLLVIMDSVRSNRGFVVFATTHAPFTLDPALRRPGRLDETISLPSLPNLINRWEIFKANLSSFTHTLDFVDYSLLSANLTDTQISNFISKTKLLLFNSFDMTTKMTSYKYHPNFDTKINLISKISAMNNEVIASAKQSHVSDIKNISEDGSHLLEMIEKSPFEYHIFKKRDSGVFGYDNHKRHSFHSKYVSNQSAKYLSNEHKTIYSLNQAVKITTNADILEPYQITKRIRRALIKVNKTKNNSDRTHSQDKPRSLSTLLKSFEVYPAIQKGSSNLLSLTYFQMGKFLINSQLVFDQTSYGRITWSKFLVSHNLEEQIFRDLYGARYDLNQILMRLFSGKVGEFFIFNNSSLCRYFYSAQNKMTSHGQAMYPHFSSNDTKAISIFHSDIKNVRWTSEQISNISDENDMKINTQTPSTAVSGGVQTENVADIKNIRSGSKADAAALLRKPQTAQQTSMDEFSNQSSPISIDLIQNGFQHSGFWNLVGIHPFWNSANSFVSSLMQKRYLYDKNLLISRMLYFEDVSTRREPPSPPNSSILMPAKKYENLKRTEHDFQQKANMSIHEKIRLHQQQRLMKKLYNRPVDEYFRSEMIENRFTKFSSSIKELGYLNSFTRRSSSVNCYYKNRILIRHQFSLMNQWWNGQLAEHNAETTFLSDVDWRSIFNKSLGDLLIDFPDADQHYNPRHRRWFLQSSHWGYWNTFEKTMTQEISYHFTIQCFNKAYDFLNNEREILDYFAHSFLQKGLLNEIHLITTLSRFYNSPTTILK